jgi:hypothetical protein
MTSSYFSTFLAAVEVQALDLPLGVRDRLGDPLVLDRHVLGIFRRVMIFSTADALNSRIRSSSRERKNRLTPGSP